MAFLAETVGFEPTCPCGQPDFESGSLRPLRYVSMTFLLYQWQPTFATLNVAQGTKAIAESHGGSFFSLFFYGK